jgi:hypothetical protein
MRSRAAPLYRALVSALSGICLLAAAGASIPASAQDDTLAAQRRIEAAYLYKFGGYITWPAEAFPGPDSPFIIGVAGDDAMADELETLVAGRSMNGRAVVVKRIHAGQSIAGIHIMFVAAGTAQGETLIAAAHDISTVAVTEGDDGLERGAGFSFVLVNDRVRFDVALDAAQTGGVKVSSQLLSVADKVTGVKP